MGNRMPQVQPVTDPLPDTPRSASKAASIPLAVAYAALPLATAALHGTGPGPEAAPFLPWLILAGFGTVWAILFRRSGVPVKKRFLFEVLIFAALTTLFYLRRDALLYQLEIALPYIRELGPVWIIGFSILWAATFGLPDRGAFQRYGALLGALCVADLAVGAFLLNGVPVERWAGNPDLLAGLLLVALAAGLGPEDGGGWTDGFGHPALRALILLGLAACLSRTGLFAAGWILLFFGRGSKLRRALTALLLFLLLAATFVLPYAQADGARYLDYWLWAQSVALFLRDPGVLLTGAGIGQALPFAIPPELAPIWERIMHTPALLGAHLPQVESFWLRALLAWGAPPTLACLAGVFVLLARRMTPMGAGLSAVLFAQGMSTPLFHAPALGVPLGLALVLALSAPRGPAAASPAPRTPASPGTDDADPAREWKMRPL